jgi:hypothetical protein
MAFNSAKQSVSVEVKIYLRRRDPISSVSFDGR